MKQSKKPRVKAGSAAARASKARQAVPASETAPIVLVSDATPAVPAGDVAPVAPFNAALVLPANCTIREIAVLHDCLRSASPEAALDGSAVQRIDTAGLQLLVAFISARRTAHAAIQWQGASQALCDAAALLGLTTTINLPVAT